MAYEQAPLPYAFDALEPHIDARTMEIHYGKHHAGYVSKLNAAIEGTDLASKSLVDIIRAGGATFNNAAQVWNHTFYWNSMAPGGGGQPSGAIADAIKGSFGSYDKVAKSEFRPGEQVLVYAEIENFKTELTSQSGNHILFGNQPHFLQNDSQALRGPFLLLQSSFQRGTIQDTCINKNITETFSSAHRFTWPDMSAFPIHSYP